MTYAEATQLKREWDEKCIKGQLFIRNGLVYRQCGPSILAGDDETGWSVLAPSGVNVLHASPLLTLNKEGK